MWAQMKGTDPPVWLFADTVDGANSSASLYSLIETAKANNSKPCSYLVLLCTMLPLARAVDDYKVLQAWNIPLGKPHGAARGTAIAVPKGLVHRRPTRHCLPCSRVTNPANMSHGERW